ncbi:glycosyltransferase family 4 protein, partial [Acidobacteriota bacterium]
MNIETVIVALFASMITSAILTPLVRRASLSLGLLDRPDRSRKNHREAVPRIGGLAIYAAFLVPLIVLFFAGRGAEGHLGPDPKAFLGLLAGGTLIFLMGFVDDIRNLGAYSKLLVQLAAAAIAWFAGFRITLITSPLSGSVELGFLSLPLTLLWVIGITNAINLIDGLDGVACGIMVFATGTTLI